MLWIEFVIHLFLNTTSIQIDSFIIGPWLECVFVKQIQSHLLDSVLIDGVLSFECTHF